MTYQTAAPFAHTLGPHKAKIAIVGEAWGEQEEIVGRPFMGHSGQELTRMLTEAGIERKDCFLTNVLALRPPDNKLEAICQNKAEVGKDYSLPPLGTGKYLPQVYLPELDRLKIELTEVQPNIIVALGATATWALLHSAKIGGIRGAVAESRLLPGFKCLGTYHPAAILRNWSWRVIAVADLMKAKRESEFPEIRRPDRRIITCPTLADIEAWAKTPAQTYAVDIETAIRQMTMIGFARSRHDALVIPFVDPSKPGGSYWDTPEEEVQAWLWVKYLLESPAEKIFQNGLYDLQYIYRFGFRPRHCTKDTMLLHHALYPELQKGLGFLGSIYTSEASWKLMRHATPTTKKDE